MVNAVLAAVAVAIAEGIDLDRAVTALEALGPAPGRLETRRLPGGVLLLLDHRKSQMETIDSALDVFDGIEARRKVLVLGDVDEPPAWNLDEVTAIYARLGERIASIADRAVTAHVDVGGPRPDYAEGALGAGLAADAFVRVDTVGDAVRALEGELRDGDVVLIKGSGQQRFHRIELALAGREVHCNITVCHAHVTCDVCPMLERRPPDDGGATS